MNKKLVIPGFIFKPVYSENTTKEIIRRQDDTLEFEFPMFDKNMVLKTAEKLAQKKRRAHDRNIEDVFEIIEQVGALWANPTYDIRKEVLEVLPMLTGQSRELCELELIGTFRLWNKKNAEMELLGQIGGKEYLEKWISKDDVRLHAQPRGVILHNLAGNGFGLGPTSLSYGILTKNMNLVKLSHQEPFVSVKLCESIADVDMKMSKELVALYWKGSRGDIYDELFQSGNVDAVLAWGAIKSIEELRRRAYRFGIKIIDNGPKLSFSVISEDVFQDMNIMQKIAQKVALDVVYWNQRACLSPRVIYVIDNPNKSTLSEDYSNNSQSLKQGDLFGSSKGSFFNDTFDASDSHNENGDYDMSAIMQRSLKILRNSYSELSPLGFAKMLAKGLESLDNVLPRANLTQTDSLDMERKREYFFINYVAQKQATIITPPKNRRDWTVIFMRSLPKLNELHMAQDRFIIVTRISHIHDLIYSIRRQKLQQYLQTCAIYGSDKFVRDVAEELSLLGAFRFPKIGEHNSQGFGLPWDGTYILQDLIRWSYICYKIADINNKEENSIVLFETR